MAKYQQQPGLLKESFKQYIHTIKSSDAIGRAQYLGNGNGPLLPIEL